MSETQTAYAKSTFSDPQNIWSAIAFFVAISSDPSILALVPLEWLPKITAAAMLGSILIRHFKGTHPVALIAPREVKPVEVPKRTATQPGTEDADKLMEPK